MPASTIYVHSGGAPFRGAKVQLSFLTGGVTGHAYTDSSGKATVEHVATGAAKVIVDGVTKTTMQAPGSVSVAR